MTILGFIARILAGATRYSIALAAALMLSRIAANHASVPTSWEATLNATSPWRSGSIVQDRRLDDSMPIAVWKCLNVPLFESVADTNTELGLLLIFFISLPGR